MANTRAAYADAMKLTPATVRAMASTSSAFAAWNAMFVTWLARGDVAPQMAAS